jgi:hypothetical protein
MAELLTSWFAYVLASIIPRGLFIPSHIYPPPQDVVSPGPTEGGYYPGILGNRTGAMQVSGYGLLRIPLLGTSVNKGVVPNLSAAFT